MSHVTLEKPVSLEDKETIDTFNNALSKAKLLYSDIEISEKYQIALVSNEFGSGYILMYTSERDKRVHSKELTYDRVWMDGKTRRYYSGYRIDKEKAVKNGFLITQIGGKDTKESDERYGMISHTGEEILKPIYKFIEDTYERYILTYDGEESTLWSYDGKIIVRTAGELTIHRARLLVEGEPTTIIVNELDSRYILLALWKNNLYKIDTGPYNGRIYIFKEQLFMAGPVNTWAMKNEQIKEAMDKNGPIEIPENEPWDEDAWHWGEISI